MNVEMQDTSREIVLSDKMGAEAVTVMAAEMEMEMVAETEAAADYMSKALEPVQETEADFAVKANEKILDQEVKDPVKETDTTDRSFLEMAPMSRSCLPSPCCSTGNVGCGGIGLCPNCFTPGVVSLRYSTSLWRYPASP